MKPASLVWLPFSIMFFFTCTVLGALVLHSTAGPNWKKHHDDE